MANVPTAVLTVWFSATWLLSRVMSVGSSLTSFRVMVMVAVLDWLGVPSSVT